MSDLDLLHRIQPKKEEAVKVDPCAGVANLFISPGYAPLFGRPKEFYPVKSRGFFSLRNIRLELNSPSGASAETEKEERSEGEGGVGGEERDGGKDATRGKKKGAMGAKERRGCQACVVGLLPCINCGRWIFKTSTLFNATHTQPQLHPTRIVS